MKTLSNTTILILFLASALFAPFAQGQENFILTLGTTRPTGDQHWAYVMWQPTGLDLTAQPAFAVYSKEGGPASAEPYQLRAIARVQTDPAVIQTLLEQSTAVGQDLADLEEDVDGMFGEIIPNNAFGLADKLSIVIRGCLENRRHLDNLILLSQLSSGIRLCLGLAHVELIPGPAGTERTFEVRAHNPATQQDLAVLGRVTITAGEPVVLPAPGRPVEVPETTAKGHLNVRLRWGAPDPLRRLSPLQLGFNVYRVEAAIAEENGWDLAPPSIDALLHLVRQGEHAHRINQTPIMVSRLLTTIEAANLDFEPELYYMADDNERFHQEPPLPQEGFENGARFYYYATARDILGADGLVSPGTLVTICDRMPPGAPRRVEVRNDYRYDAQTQTEDQRLLISWDQNQDPPGENTVSYFVYRWNSIPEKNALLADGLGTPIAGPIPHDPNAGRLSYRDDQPGAPTVAADAGKTIWYTVVAVDDGACGGNESPHSAPAFGVLRDRVGPLGRGPGGSIDITCINPRVIWQPPGQNLPVHNPKATVRFFLVNAQRSSLGIAWAEFFISMPGSTNLAPLGKTFFTSTNALVSLLHTVELPNAAANPGRILHCRVGTFSGRISALASTTLVAPPSADQMLSLFFSASVITETAAGGPDCSVHDPNPDGGTDGSINPIIITLFFPPGSREWRLYRRVDEGPLTLLRQGEGNPDQGELSEVVEDIDLPANAATVCYYAQYFDEHGNPGPLLRLGCVETAGRTDLPAPILKPIVSAGTQEKSRMKIEWFCPPYGVERFQVWILGAPIPAPPDPAETLAAAEDGPVALDVPLAGHPDPKFRVFKTPRIGPGFGEGPLFSTEADVELGDRYVVFVKALDKHDKAGPESNLESFLWGVTNQPVENVAWPARPLPLATDANFPQVEARVILTNSFAPPPPRPFEGVAIRIGEVDHEQILAPTIQVSDTLQGIVDPMDFVYRGVLSGDPVLGVAAYRYQVSNDEFPEVSGDVIQVSPLMEDIAYTTGNVQGQPATIIQDPFIRIFPEGDGPAKQGIYLIDTQPLVLGARYQYVLLRFDNLTHEIAEVILPDPVDLPAE